VSNVLCLAKFAEYRILTAMKMFDTLEIVEVVDMLGNSLLIGILAILAGVLILTGLLSTALVVGIFLIVWGILALMGRK
jgi:hypothetical protein